MRILALDPGTTQTAWVLWDTCGDLVEFGIHGNEDMRETVRVMIEDFAPDQLAVEMIASYGMPVGAEVFQTCVWIGRFVQLWVTSTGNPWQFVYRRDVKLELCNSAKAKDGNVRQALLDRVGPQGTKKAPGPTYGVSKDVWSALGVAITAAKQQEISTG